MDALENQLKEARFLAEEADKKYDEVFIASVSFGLACTWYAARDYKSHARCVAFQVWFPSKIEPFPFSPFDVSKHNWLRSATN